MCGVCQLSLCGTEWSHSKVLEPATAVCHNMEVFQGLVHKHTFRAKWSVHITVDGCFPGVSVGWGSTYLYYVLFVEPNICGQRTINWLNSGLWECNPNHWNNSKHESMYHSSHGKSCRPWRKLVASSVSKCRSRLGSISAATLQY